MAKRILVPFGQGEPAQAILPLAAAVARDGGATVRLLRVYPVPEHLVGPHGRTIAYADQEMDRLTRQGTIELETVAGAALAGVPVETAVRFGDPVAEILIEAETFGADLIALTTTGRSWLRRALVGGTSDEVARKATAPTLVLRA